MNGEDNQNDTFTINFANGNPIPSGGVFVHGGTGADDTIVLTGGSFSSVTQTFTGPGAATIDLGSNASIDITYDGMEPDDQTGMTVDNRIFNLPAAVGDAKLEDLGTAVDGNSVIRSTSAAFEEVQFKNPSQSLTINGTSGATACPSMPSITGSAPR